MVDENQTLYHGSTVPVARVDLAFSNPRKDFGAGFYLSTSKDQAVNFARLKAGKTPGSAAVLSTFRSSNCASLSIKVFPEPGREWLDFILSNRRPELVPIRYDADIIIGPIANDAVGVTLNLLIIGAYGDPGSDEAKAIAINALLPQKLDQQIVYLTQRAANSLQFVKSQTL